MKGNDIVYLKKDRKKLTSWIRHGFHFDGLFETKPYTISHIGRYDFGDGSVDTLCLNGFGGWVDKEWFITSDEYFAQEGNIEVEFIVGAWYKFKTGNNYAYAKFLKIEDKIWKASEWISQYGTFVPTISNLGGVEDYKRKLLTDLSEIQQSLPEGHVDKFPVDGGDEWKPRVGEYVTLNVEYCRLKAGSTYKVIGLQSKECVNVDHSGESSYLAPFIINCRKATPEEIAVKDLSSFVKQSIAFIKGDDAEALALKNERLARAAFKMEVNLVDSLIVSLEDAVETATANYEKVFYPTELIDDRKRYMQRIADAKKAKEEAEFNLQEALNSKEFYETELNTRF